MPQNVEIKARTKRAEDLRKILLDKGADFKGVDTQLDTYFCVNNGRLKLREGEIENNLIHYQRENSEEAKFSDVLLHKPNDSESLKSVLSKALGVFVEVHKQREIYFIGNVKFHLDEVRDLGNFVEIEAIDTDGAFSQQQLTEQCEYYQNLLGILPEDLIALSYSDLLLQDSSEK